MLLNTRNQFFASFWNFYPLKVFWLKHFFGRNPLMKFKNACKAPKIIKKWLADHNLSSNVCGSNLPISAVSIGKWAFKVLQTLTSAHTFSAQTWFRMILRPKLSGPKSVELKNTKSWNLAKFLLKKTFFQCSKMTSAGSKMSWKRL